MSDRHAGYVVTLDQDMPSEYAQKIIDAIQMLKGVVSVKPIIGNVELQLMRERVHSELKRKILDAISTTSCIGN